MLCRRIAWLSRPVAAVALLVVSFSLIAQAQDTDRRGRKYKAPPPTARISVTILRFYNGKPIENAAVVFHPMQGERDKGNMELKTNEDGKTVIDVIPIGDVVRMQVIAKGFQTYGGDYKIDKPELAIEVKMKRPGEQYSIYKAHVPGADPNAGEGKETSQGASSASPSSDVKDAPKDKPADSPAQPSSQPNSTQPQPK